MRRVVLHGDLATEFGREFMFAANTVGHAVRLLCANFKKFSTYCNKREFNVVVSRGDIDAGEDFAIQPRQQFHLNLEEGCDIHIIPVVAGAGGGNGKGIFSIILGVVLVGLAIAFTGGAAAALAAGNISGTAALLAGSSVFIFSASSVALLGFGLIIGGIAQLLTPIPGLGNDKKGDDNQRQSFLFNGPVNTVEQGGPVPVIYGRSVWVGSVVVSAGLTVERVEILEDPDEDGSTGTPWWGDKSSVIFA